MKNMVVTTWMALLLVAVMVGCAPAAAPAPAPPAAPAPVPAPALGPEEAAWAKVVEAAKKEGTFTGYMSAAFAGAEGPIVAKSFEEKYGIKADLISGASPAQLERIRTEFRAGKQVTDIALSSQIALLTLRKEGMLQPWGNLPVAKEDVWVFPAMYDEVGDIISFGKYFGVSYVNTNLVKAGEEPTSYQDFLSAKWKGKIVITPTQFLVPVLYANLKYHKVVDVDDYYRQMAKQEMKVATEYTDAITMVARGEAHLGFVIHESYANRFLAEGAPVKPLYMKEGVTMRNLYALSLLGNAPHPNAARVFMNWWLSKEGQTQYSSLKKTSPGRKDVPDVSPTGKIIGPIAKVLFVQNKAVDLEASRVARERVHFKLLGMEK